MCIKETFSSIHIIKYESYVELTLNKKDAEAIFDMLQHLLDLI